MLPGSNPTGRRLSTEDPVSRLSEDEDLYQDAELVFLHAIRKALTDINHYTIATKTANPWCSNRLWAKEASWDRSRRQRSNKPHATGATDIGHPLRNLSPDFSGIRCTQFPQIYQTPWHHCHGGPDRCNILRYEHCHMKGTLNFEKDWPLYGPEPFYSSFVDTIKAE